MSGDLLDLEKLPLLQDELYNIRDKWFDIGVQLGLDNGTLQSIKTENSNTGDALREVLTYWLKRNSSSTWGALFKALRSRPVGAGSIVDTLLKSAILTPDDSITAEGTYSKNLYRSHRPTEFRVRHTEL